MRPHLSQPAAAHVGMLRSPTLVPTVPTCCCSRRTSGSFLLLLFLSFFSLGLTRLRRPLGTSLGYFPGLSRPVFV